MRDDLLQGLARPDGAPTDADSDRADPDSESQMILWADVGERLRLDKAGLRNLRTTFSDVLGLDSSKNVHASIVPVLAHIQSLRRMGVPDGDIRDQIANLPQGHRWPEEVLERMQSVVEDNDIQVELAADRLQGEIIEERALAETADGSTRSEVIGDCVPVKPSAISAFSEQAIREMTIDLRRELATHAISERELVYHLMECVQRLTLEVRDLRYAFLLASSRKDRKKGLKVISRLLSG